MRVQRPSPSPSRRPAAPLPAAKKKALQQKRKQAEGLLERVGWEAGRVDGKIDKRSRAAIRGFQRGRGLKVTGRLNNATLKQLRRAEKLQRAGVLSPGVRSALVKGFEKRLRQAGFSPGKIDKKYDKKTARAVALVKKHYGAKQPSGLASRLVRRATSKLAAKKMRARRGGMSRTVMKRAKAIGDRINATGGYRFDGHNDCWGFVRRVMDPVLNKRGLPAIPTADAGTAAGRRNWDRITNWKSIPVGTPLSTHEGHAWGAHWHGGLFAGVKNGVPYIYDNSGSRSAKLRPAPPGLLQYFHRPSARALR